MEETNYLVGCEQNEYDAYLSLALSSGDEEVQYALEEASFDEE